MSKTNKKTKKTAALTVLAFLTLGVVTFSSSCAGSPEIVGIHMTSSETVQVYYGHFSCEGIGVTVDFRDGSTKDIALTEEMISEVEQLKFFKVGIQEIEVVYRNRYSTTMPVEVVLNEFKESYELVGYECVYDGQPHSVGLNQELPEGATITYPYGNIFTNAGSYEVVGIMSKNGYASKTLTATLTIFQAERDATGMVFEDSTVIYDGEMHTIEVQNVPEGVNVTYDTYDFDHDIRINKVVNAGKYRVVARFTDTSLNYAQIPDKTAVLTIKKATYDLSGISFPAVTKVYDGLDYQAKIVGENTLPTGVKVKYSYLDADGKTVISNAKVGDYTMVATFEGGDLTNYEPIEGMTAPLVVRPRVIKISDKITFESKTVNFQEGTVHSLAITGELPESVEVTYEGNDQTYAGEYEVKAIFRATNENEVVDVEEMTAYLIINKVRRSVKVYNEETQKYDSDFSGKNIHIVDNVVQVVGIDTETFAVILADLYCLSDNTKITENFVITKPELLIVGQTYKYKVYFAYTDPLINSSVILSAETDNYTHVEA